MDGLVYSVLIVSSVRAHHTKADCCQRSEDWDGLLKEKRMQKTAQKVGCTVD